MTDRALHYLVNSANYLIGEKVTKDCHYPCMVYISRNFRTRLFNQIGFVPEQIHTLVGELEVFINEDSPRVPWVVVK